jgi:hypothetical protein
MIRIGKGPCFDLHTVGFWVLKNARKMADSDAPPLESGMAGLVL